VSLKVDYAVQATTAPVDAIRTEGIKVLAGTYQTAMPANLPPEAKAKWLKVSEAKTPEEKLRALKEFLAVVPKHKGTEKLRRQIKRQMAILRREIETARKKKGKRFSFFVEKEGDIQLVLLGLPNSGKSALLKALTKANVSSSSEPFETKRPVPGMLKWGGVYFQIVDTPSIIEGAARGAGLGAQVLAMARNADGIVLVVDLAGDPAYQITTLLRELEEFQISVTWRGCEVQIERRREGGMVVQGGLVGCSVADVQRLLRSYGVHNALVRIKGRASLDDIEEAIVSPRLFKPALVIASKFDLAPENLATLEETLKSSGAALEVVPVNALSIPGDVVDRIAEFFFKQLDLIRVYTRNPRTGEVAERPIVVKRGVRVIDVAEMIHSSLYKNFRYARVWSERLRFSPQRVGGDFVLEDGDVVEIVAKA